MKIKLQTFQTVANSLLRPNFLKDFSKNYKEGFEKSLINLSKIS